VISSLGAGVTVTKADAVAVPPGPVAVAVYVALWAGLTVTVPPVTGKFAGEESAVPSVPCRIRLVAFVAVKVRVAEPGATMVVGLAVRVTVGGPAGTTVTVAVAVAGVVPAAPVAVAV
jgi:hypothetical protein